MRFFLFSLLFTSTLYAQVDGNCTEATITDAGAPDLVFDCATLTIGAGTHVIPNLGGGQILDITVSGEVTIDAGAVVVLRGGSGSTAVDNTPGGVAGPGGTDGGDNTNFGPNNAPEDLPPDDCGGDQGIGDPACGGGGGGGGFRNAGSAGAACVNAAGGLGGSAYSSLATTFRGGYGGGAGGTPDGGSPVRSATGGGGGGAIRIVAGGNVTIRGNIDVRGGNGGSSPAGSNAGGGGGGSGGAIRITSSGQLINNGTFLLSGGTGGNGDGAGARGGDGSEGIFQLQDADNTIFGVGTGANGINPFANATPTLNSSISCGAIAEVDQRNTFFSLLLGIILFFGISRVRVRNRGSI